MYGFKYEKNTNCINVVTPLFKGHIAEKFNDLFNSTIKLCGFFGFLFFLVVVKYGAKKGLVDHRHKSDKWS